MHEFFFRKKERKKKEERKRTIDLSEADLGARRRTARSLGDWKISRRSCWGQEKKVASFEMMALARSSVLMVAQLALSISGAPRCHEYLFLMSARKKSWFSKKSERTRKKDG